MLAVVVQSIPFRGAVPAFFVWRLGSSQFRVRVVGSVRAMKGPEKKYKRCKFDDSKKAEE